MEVLEAGSRWVALGWSLDGSTATHYVIQFHREHHSSPAGPSPPPLWYNVTVSGGSHHSKLTGLDPATTYTVRVLPANEVGVGPASEPVSAQTLQEGESPFTYQTTVLI